MAVTVFKQQWFLKKYKKIKSFDRFHFECRSQKRTKHLLRSFFIQADRFGISSRRSRVYHRRRRISSHEVCISVGLMIYKTKVLMICNSYGIDAIRAKPVIPRRDIQCFALIFRRFYAIRKSREFHGFLFNYLSHLKDTSLPCFCHSKYSAVAANSTSPAELSAVSTES